MDIYHLHIRITYLYPFSYYLKKKEEIFLLYRFSAKAFKYVEEIINYKPEELIKYKNEYKVVYSWINKYLYINKKLDHF